MRFVFAFLVGLTTASVAWGHGNHGAMADGAQIYRRLVEDQFFLGEPAETPALVVQLADGTRYAVRSVFLGSVRKIIDTITEPDGARDVEPLLKLRQKLNKRLEVLRSRGLWITLGADLSEFFVRRGPLTLATMLVAEAFEHAPISFGALLPLPPLCGPIQAACVMASQQLQNLWGSVRYAYPPTMNWRQRWVRGFGGMRSDFLRWRAMRSLATPAGFVTRKQMEEVYTEGLKEIVLSTPFWPVLTLPRQACQDPRCGSVFARSPPLTKGRWQKPAADGITTFVREMLAEPDPAARVAQAQTALDFFYLQINLAKNAVAATAKHDPSRYFQLRMTLARLAKVVDRLTPILRAQAKTPSTASLVFLESWMQQLVDYHRLFASAMDQSDPPPNLWTEPIELAKSLAAHRLAPTCLDLLRGRGGGRQAAFNGRSDFTY